MATSISIVGVNDGPPVALRNNGDGTWRRQQPFSGVAGLRAFAWGDLDRDGDPDAALLDAQGALHLFENRQGGQFDAMSGPADVGRVVALALGDVNGDGVIDVILLDDKGTIRRASYDGEKWDRADAHRLGRELAAARLLARIDCWSKISTTTDRRILWRPAPDDRRSGCQTATVTSRRFPHTPSADIFSSRRSQ